MQLRDAGKLDLDDRLEQHLPGIANGSPTLRRMLAHLSGLQREAGRDVRDRRRRRRSTRWSRRWPSTSSCSPPARAHHYSNLAYALLGEVVARRERRCPTPSTSTSGSSRRSGSTGRPGTSRSRAPLGYLVDEFAGTAAREPSHRTWAASPRWDSSGRRSATSARWADVLVEGREGVLDPATADEMWAPQVMMNPDDWTVGWGLGLELVSHEGRIFGGHGGAMPGFLAGALRQPRVEDRRRRADELRYARGDAGHRARARGGDARALAARDRAVAARGRRRRPRSRRSSAAGGRRATSSSSPGRTAS